MTLYTFVFSVASKQAKNALDVHAVPAVNAANNSAFVRNGTDDALVVLTGNVRTFVPMSLGGGMRCTSGIGAIVYMVQEANVWVPKIREFSFFVMEDKACFVLIQDTVELTSALRVLAAAVRHNAYMTVHMEGLGYQVLHQQPSTSSLDVISSGCRQRCRWWPCL